jgi:hypothetical protein
VHGIVLSAGCDIVTIVDFGASNAKSQKNNKITESQELEDMIDREDQAMVEACEKHRKEHLGAGRIHIITLTEETEIKRWKKVNYGEALKKNWRWWKKADTNIKVEKIKTESSGEGQPEGVLEATTVSALHVDDEILSTDLHPKRPSSWWGCKDAQDETRIQSSQEESKLGQESETQQKVPSLPKSDPEHLVLSRVRYLLNNPQELPPHHILFSNSECIAVWCKTGEFCILCMFTIFFSTRTCELWAMMTHVENLCELGRWSTLQASIFLYSTAAGNLKTMILSSTGAAAATTTVTLPAGGIAGWFGMTTTTTVSLLSVQPWLIPVLAGYGLIAVGTPIILAIKAKERWEAATTKLNDAFWGNAESDVYVEAIKSWSNLE